jgi:ABC-type cobalt transport system substrate-binding protein
MRYLVSWFAAVTIAAGIAITPRLSAASDDAKWKGVDETVIEKVLTESGHPPRKPFINTDQGDLLLFLFLLAGAGGGFVAGYAFRSLFPPRTAAKNHAPYP